MSARSYINRRIKRKLKRYLSTAPRGSSHAALHPPARAYKPRAKFRFPHLIKMELLKELLYRMAVAAVLLLLIVGGWRLLHPGVKIKASVDTVAAFRVPYRSIGMLKAYAAKHGVPFSQLFVLFCAENNFFPEKNTTYDLSRLESQYVENFDRLKRKYDANQIEPYFEMFKNLFDEIECFPIPAGYEDEETLSWMYGDSWGVSRNSEDDKWHRGADIMDRENVRGRIPVMSITNGAVQDAGWQDALGYYVGVVTQNGTYYQYAHLDSLAANIAAGQPVSAGQELGRMGDSGTSRDGNVFQVHLHIGISPRAGFTKNKFWINPYPLLRYIENTPLF